MFSRDTLSRMAGKRRGRGEGGLEQVPDGRWRATLSLGIDPVTKKRRQRRFYGKTKQEALAKLRDAQALHGRGQLAQDNGTTVGQWLTHWINTKRQNVDLRTVDGYESHCTAHIGPILGAVLLSKLKPTDVETLYAKLSERGVSGSMRNKIGTTLRMALKHAVRFHVLPSNPASLVQRPRKDRVEIHPLSKENVSLFLTAAKTHRLYPLFVLAIDSGMRLGELLALSWDCVDLDAATVTVKRSLDTKGKGGPRVKDVKTKHSRRRIRLVPGTVAALRQLQLRTGPVFANTRGGYLAHNNLTRRVLKGILRRAGLQGIRFHDLRHTCATLLLSAGVNVKAVASRLGHSSVVITLDTYAHVMPEDDASIMREMCKIVQYAESPHNLPGTFIHGLGI